MEKTSVLKAEKREQVGSKAAARVRKQGRIPAIVYGHKEESVAITINEHDLGQALQHGHRLLDLQIGRKREKMLIKDIQYDHLGKDVIHADLMRVDVSETIKVTVPIELKGVAKGTHEGGIVQEHVDHLEVECRVTDIPETIVVSVKDLDIDDALHAADIALPEGVRLASEPSLLVVTCSVVIAPKTTEEAEAEAPVAPEVIGQAKEAEEEESSEEAQKK
ncbi:MAG TPA: 50S ribosomal protein L25 [Sedimentisphaerales bacterium]|nr:50S ribosomal protein L25 [Sedimentisphaerales bacterium]